MSKKEHQDLFDCKKTSMFTNDYVHVSGVNTRSNAVFNGNLKKKLKL